MTDQAPDIARHHTTTEVLIAQVGQTAEEVRRQLASRTLDYAGEVAVLSGTRFAGLVAIESLLTCRGDARLANLMNASPPVVAPGADQESVAWEMVRCGGSCAAVVDAEGAFVGLIPPRQMLEVLLTEHHEDLARLGGYLSQTQSARNAAEETIVRRLWHRLPWLLLGLGGAMIAAIVVGGFEEELDKTVLLAFFLPAVVYMADADGTQTETLLIRGLSVGVQLRDVVTRELATGLIVGVLMGAAFLPFALLVWGDGQVAAAVGLALFASCSIATLVAMLFPWLFHRFGVDPAFGSGPLATVVQDLLSITVYLLIATAIVD